MRKTMRVLARVVLLILASLVFAKPARAFELQNAREVTDNYGLSIAMKQNQRVVMYDPKLLATSVLAAVKAPFERTAPLLRRLARARYGEKAWQDQERSDFYYWEKRHGRFTEEREKRLKELKSANVVVEKFREITYESDKYNIWTVLGWTRGHSTLRIWILDGQDIFAIPSTVIRLQRRDEVYAWGWVVHNPIPSFHRQGAEFVSEHELALVQELVRAAEAPLANYPERNFSDSLLDSTPMVIQAAKWLRSQP